MYRIAGLVLVAACGRVGFEMTPNDGVPTDAGPGTAPLFADGFEGTLAPWTANGNVAVTSGPPTPFEGSSMLIAQCDSSSCTSRAEVPMPMTISSGTVYVRAYFYIPSGFPVNDISIEEFVQTGPTNLVLTSSPDIGLYDAIDMSLTGQGTFALPRDVWSCVETQVVIAAAPAGSWKASVDGTNRYSVTATNTFAGGFDRLTIGITWAGATQPPSTVYVDDVVVDLKPIGCH
jgi:hypothetical protein